MGRRVELPRPLLRAALAAHSAAVGALFAVGDALFGWLLRRYGDGLSVCGFRVEDPWDLLAPGDRVENLRAALELMAAADARRFTRLRREIRSIAIAPLGGQSYLGPDGELFLDAGQLTTFRSEYLAVQFVALLTWHRFRLAGRRRRCVRRRVWTADAYAQVLRRMHLEARAFAERLGAAPELQGWVNQWLGGPPRQAVLLAQRERSLAAVGAPGWVVRAHRRLRGEPLPPAT